MSAEAASSQVPDVTGWRDTTLRRSTEAPRRARQVIRPWLAASDPATRSHALLVISELVTNAIQHVPVGERRDWVRVRLGFGEGFVRLEVIDPGTSSSEPRFEPLRQGSMEQQGRGLGLVAHLSTRYGTWLTEGGHRAVWADLAYTVPQE